MILGTMDTEKKVVIVAEVGNNHEGNFSLAEEMVLRAAEAGADAVKFQTIRPEFFTSQSWKARFETLKRFELSDEEFVKLKSAADAAGVMFISTPFDIGSARFLNDLMPAFKIASGDNTFYPMIEVIARFGKPIILSCGMASLPEIRYTKAFVERIWREEGVHQELAVLHCVSAYPVPPSEANLSVIGLLQRDLGCVVGYSDHTIGIEAAVLSVAAGARIVEKHFTTDKNHSDFRDHKLSADPADLKRLVERIRETEALLGGGAKAVFDSEKDNVKLMRRSICAARPLRKGDVIGIDDIIWLRPGEGIEPGKEWLVLGKTLVRDLAQGEPFTLEHLESGKSSR